jgi:hypothetical protein
VKYLPIALAIKLSKVGSIPAWQLWKFWLNVFKITVMAEPLLIPDLDENLVALLRPRAADI